MKVKIISGVYGYKSNNRVIAKKSGDIITVNDKEGKRLIGLKVAIEVVEEVSEEATNEGQKEETVEEVAEETDDEESEEEIDLDSMKVAELRKYAQSLGLATSGTKAELIKRINEYEVESPNLEVADIQ